MIVSHAHKFIFFHNPKCAGMSFRDVLQPYHDDKFSFWGIFYASYFKNRIDHSHLRLWEMQAQHPKIFACAQSYNSVIFVRNPYLRFLSAVNEHMKKFQPQIDLVSMAPAQRVEVIEGFIQRVLNIERITTDWRFIHFSPQLWFLRLGGFVVPRHIVAMGAGNGFMVEALLRLGLPNLPLPHINASPVDFTAALASPIVKKYVQEFYADDFVFFRETKGLERLGEMPGV